ncbi:helix-turn-helix domain-containing protein [Paenibacillus pasadenensis]|uniref:helix-turn-helix domain-containing protein n=1 Tax=Paenibacillus TaxID=44249 RepID=UPI0006945640|nr:MULTISPECIES: AraC family transcriptional regulator [Paenibacillus]QGG58191.1 helix-turn-helix domain-containing protein [Paenibacillus sp. B01]
MSWYNGPLPAPGAPAVKPLAPADAPAVSIVLCDYSRHEQPFQQSMRGGLECYLFRLQIEGQASVLLGGRMETVLPGELLLFPPGEAYEIDIVPGGDEPGHGASADYYFMATGSWLDRWWQQEARPRRARIADDGKIQGIWHQLALESRRLDGGSPEILSALLQALCLLLERAIREAPAKGGPGALLAMKLKHFVEAHATRAFTLDEAAAHVGISKTRAVHLFKQETGGSIMQYAQQVRLALALRLMAGSQLTLEQIADEAGFGSYTYFHRVFREKYGVPPGAYRRRE